MSTAVKHPLPDRVKPSFVIFDMRQSARMSKITNDGLTRSDRDVLQLYPYGNSRRKRVNMLTESVTVWLRYCSYSRFHARDAMRKRDICCRKVSVCSSVRMSVTIRYCVKTA